MPGCRTVLLSTVMTASVRWRASPGRMSCRSHVLVTFCTASSPTDMQWPRWPRRCWVLRNARWRLPTTARMVSAVAWGFVWISHDTKLLQWAAFKMHTDCHFVFFPNLRWNIYLSYLNTRQTKLLFTVVLIHMLLQWGSFLVVTKCYLEHSVTANQWVHPFGTRRGEEQLWRFLYP